MNRKLGAMPLLGRGAATPSNTTSPGLRLTSVLSGILIHPADWPQYTNVTDRTDRQDNGPIAQGEPLYTRSPNDNVLMQTLSKVG